MRAMELTHIQVALARLSTDAVLRARFGLDPVATAESLGLCAEDAASLARMNAAGLDRFASTLVRKELKRMRHVLPRLCRVLGDRLQPLMAEFRQASPSQVDSSARGFAEFIARRLQHESLTRDVARLEGLIIRVRQSRRAIGVCCVDHRLDDARGSQGTLASKRRRMAIVFRIAGRIRVWYLPLAIARRSQSTTCVVGSEAAQ